MSQYKDAITGEIIINIRTYNDYNIIDISDTDSNSVEYTGKVEVGKDQSLFDTSSILFSKNSSMIITKPSDYPRDWTLSFWRYSKENLDMKISLDPHIRLDITNDKKNKWIHHVYVGTGNTVIEFINGSINNIISINPNEENIERIIFFSNCEMYLDDIILIAYQKLWTTDFSNNPPKNYLTGFYDKKLKRNQIIQPWDPIFINHYRNQVMSF